MKRHVIFNRMRILGRATLPLVAAAFLLLPVLRAQGQERSDEKEWAALRGGGHIVLMRHAIAPGGGDPPGFRLDDCATQRNLSEEGRAQAGKIGESFRSQEVPVERVLSSQWCRCRETARLLGLGPVEDYPVLNSFFSDRSTAEAQTEALRRFIARSAPADNIVLVTHQVNITELTGVFPSSGEMVVVRPDGRGGFDLIGRIRIARHPSTYSMVAAR
jgi:phosphohistidine phosphatase SixA